MVPEDGDHCKRRSLREQLVSWHFCGVWSMYDQRLASWLIGIPYILAISRRKYLGTLGYHAGVWRSQIADCNIGPVASMVPCTSFE